MSSLGDDLVRGFLAVVELVKNLLRRPGEGDELLLDGLICVRSDICSGCEDKTLYTRALLCQLQDVDTSVDILGQENVEGGIESYAAGTMQYVR